MSKIRSKDTKIEKLVFRELRKKAINFKKNHRKVLSSPNITLVRKKIAVFIDGDFWHDYRYKAFKNRLPNKFWREKLNEILQETGEIGQNLEEWHGKVLLKYTKEIIGSATTYIILLLILLLWHFVLGIKFHWQSISPFSAPSFFTRTFYSAFTFGTLGYFLYIIKFYKLLNDIVVKIFDMWGLYNFIKAVVWLFLMFISWAYVVPWIFNILNGGMSILFNIANFILYAAPPVGIALILSLIYILIRKKQSVQ